MNDQTHPEPHDIPIGIHAGSAAIWIRSERR